MACAARKRGPMLALAALLAAARPSGAATVEGVVTLPAAAGAPAAVRYAVPTVRPVSDPDPPAAIVYLDGAGGVQPGRATVGQQGYQFRPGLVAVTRGSVVEFPNLDDEYHSVFSYSKTRRFDLGRFQKDERPPPLTFEQPGVVKLFCDIHEHMRGHILVLDTPYFTKTDPQGRYRLEGLPAGRFVLKAWIDDDVVRERPIELGAGDDVHVDFPSE